MADSTTPVTCAKAPCKSCPYRKDVPSGLWAAHEYDKLPVYDTSILNQITEGAAGLFMCHQQDGKICAGWVGCHGSDLAAIRLQQAKLAPEVLDYESPVPLFKSGAEAAAHGKRAIKRPGAKAQRAIARLTIKQERRESDG